MDNGAVVPYESMSLPVNALESSYDGRSVLKKKMIFDSKLSIKMSQHIDGT